VTLDVIFLVCFALLLAAHTSLSPFYIALCLLCSVDIIAYANHFITKKSTNNFSSCYRQLVIL